MAEIRALSVRQPWAHAIAYWRKDVENRTWQTWYRGQIAIHASKAPDRAARDHPLIADAIARETGNQGPPVMTFGAIIAVAQLTRCHLHYPCSLSSADCGAGGRPMCSPWAAKGQYHWEIGDVIPLAEPVRCRGALGLRRLPGEVEAAVRVQLGAMAR